MNTGDHVICISDNYDHLNTKIPWLTPGSVYVVNNSETNNILLTNANDDSDFIEIIGDDGLLHFAHQNRFMQKTSAMKAISESDLSTVLTLADI